MKRNFIALLLISAFGADAALGAEDILSVNGTLFIQIALFVALIVILKRGVFDPLTELLEKREKLTTGTTEEARKLNGEVERIIKDYDLKINQARAQALEQRAEIRREAQAASDEITSKAKRESLSLLEKARAEIDAEAQKIKEKMKPEIEAIARDLASRVLGREVEN
ncbi:MAG: ATP synthase F0 subunit B [Deltaproteobacteria bacterium]